MQRYLAIFITLLSLCASAEVFYYATDSIPAPEGEITAVEVRAANPAARIGQARLAGWHLSWPGVDIALTFDFRNYVDGISETTATLSCNGTAKTIKKGLNTNGEFNTIAAEWHPDGHAAILAGQRKLTEYLRLDSLPHPIGAICISGIGGSAVVQDFIVETNPNAFNRLLTSYTPDQLSEAPRWEYLDRTNDPKTAIIGGEYLLAQINNDLIYLAGAKTNPEAWQPGMLKATLTPTGFDGYYKLQWFDATGRKMPGENFAELDNSLGVLKLTFPELGATIRLQLANKQPGR
ncbi:MAG: hypothetical protein NC301_08125 [Bacteroides sp.]|nr:hypothetical protein [Bacteroides sp.]MCM1380155.1 hypothetical protein [Bacteroides sp.]MCM1446463.1 hypothetical protein [Prevotella sp.]